MRAGLEVVVPGQTRVFEHQPQQRAWAPEMGPGSPVHQCCLVPALHQSCLKQMVDKGGRLVSEPGH